MARTVPGTNRTNTKVAIIILESENGRKITKERIQENLLELL